MLLALTAAVAACEKGSGGDGAADASPGAAKPKTTPLWPEGTEQCGSNPRENGKAVREGRSVPDSAPSGMSSVDVGITVSDDWESKDADEQDVLDSAVQAERDTQHLMYAEQDDNGDYPYEELIKRWYVEGSQAYKCRTAYATAIRDTGLQLWGHTALYDPKVSVEGKTATLSYCADHDLMEASHGTDEFALAKPGTYPKHTTELERNGDRGGTEPAKWKTVKESMDPDGCNKP